MNLALMSMVTLKLSPKVNRPLRDPEVGQISIT